MTVSLTEAEVAMIVQSLDSVDWSMASGAKEVEIGLRLKLRDAIRAHMSRAERWGLKSSLEK